MARCASARALRLRLQGALRRGKRVLTFGDHRGESFALSAKTRLLLREALTLTPNAIAHLLEFRKIALQLARFGAHLRQQGAERERRPDSLENLVWARDQRRRRLTAHPLQDGQNLHDQSAAALERSDDLALVLSKRRKPLFDFSRALFRFLQPLGRIDERAIQPFARGGVIDKLLFESTRALLGGAHRVLDAAQFLLL